MSEPNKYDLPSPLLRQLVHHPTLGEPPSDANDDSVEPAWTMENANLVTSRLGYGNLRYSPDSFHALVIDIDAPVYVVNSTTPGHSHLYLDVPMTWSQAVELLSALKWAGVIDQVWYEMSLRRGYTAVRTPWTHKSQIDWSS